jgi:hypothetical protein
MRRTEDLHRRFVPFGSAMIRYPNCRRREPAGIGRRASARMKVGIPVNRSYKGVLKLNFVACGQAGEVGNLQVNRGNVREAGIVCI